MTKMRETTKTIGTFRYERGPAAPQSVRASTASAAATGAATRPSGSLADRVKTFVDRTLDAARGRYDM
jgi:hypothetical protein